MESQYLFEKESCRKMTAKVEDLKRRLLQLQNGSQYPDEAINPALRPGPRGGTVEEQLRQEIASSRSELYYLRLFNQDLVDVIRETLLKTLGQALIDVQEGRSGRLRPEITR